MLRQIIRIDEDKCDGCGLCANACHEGAIGLVNGKAKLLREHFCDGMGDCLPACPQGAISFEDREAPAYDASAVAEAKRGRMEAPSTAPEELRAESALTNWPVQLRLVPTQSPAFADCDLLISADCCAYACGDFHNRFLSGRTAVIACPKLDQADYAAKLTEIFRLNEIHSILLTRMEVPCCGGLLRAVKTAIFNSGKQIPLRVVVLDAAGKVILDH